MLERKARTSSVFVAVSVMALALAAGGAATARAGQGSTPRDLAVGSGTAEGPHQFGKVSFSAHAGAGGEDPTGMVNLVWEDYRGGATLSVKGRVTCLAVVSPTTFTGIPGATAAIEATLDEPVLTPAFVARTIDLFVFDDGEQGSDSLDFIGAELSPLPAAEAPPCLFDGFFGFAGRMTEGGTLGRADVVIRDGGS